MHLLEIKLRSFATAGSALKQQYIIPAPINKYLNVNQQFLLSMFETTWTNHCQAQLLEKIIVTLLKKIEPNFEITFYFSGRTYSFMN